MSTRSPSELLASRDARRLVEQAEEREDHALVLLAVEALSEDCVRFFDAVAGGSVLVSAIEDPVAAGTFSERLFYRLNIIHLVAGAGPPEVTLT